MIGPGGREARLQSFGHRVCAIARTAAAAIRGAQRMKPDLILMDIMLEGYLSTRSEIDFSHGICPQCAARLYPDVDLDAHS